MCRSTFIRTKRLPGTDFRIRPLFVRIFGRKTARMRLRTFRPHGIIYNENEIRSYRILQQERILFPAIYGYSTVSVIG